MRSPEIDFIIRYRATAAESIEQRHHDVMTRMSRVGPPFGFKGLDLPPAPICRDLCTFYKIRFPIRGLKFMATYNYRSEDYLNRDEATLDDSLDYAFRASNKELDYRQILHENFPAVIEAYRGYRAGVWLGFHVIHYGDHHEASYKKLRKDPSINIDGRNNIFTLHPAVYWDALLCQRALGYGPEEVIRRLHGKVPVVKPLNDGVYIIFNDDKDLTYETFAAYNDHFKAILGLL